MKKKLKFFAAAMCVFSLTSCLESSEDFYTSIDYPGSTKVIFADQTADSLNFFTTDDWSLDTVYKQNSSIGKLFIQPKDAMYGSVPSGTYVAKSFKFTFSPNTSDTTRTLFLRLNTNNREFGADYMQVHFLNIERPDRRNYRFELTDSANHVADSLIFTTYSDWTLTAKDTNDLKENNGWVEITKKSGEVEYNNGKPKAQIVRLNLLPNNGVSDRTATLVLTSNSAKTEIYVKQLKKEEE